MEPARLKSLSLRDLFIELMEVNSKTETVAKINLATELAERLETQFNPVEFLCDLGKKLIA